MMGPKFRSFKRDQEKLRSIARYHTIRYHSSSKARLQGVSPIFEFIQLGWLRFYMYMSEKFLSWRSLLCKKYLTNSCRETFRTFYSELIKKNIWLRKTLRSCMVFELFSMMVTTRYSRKKFWMYTIYDVSMWVKILQILRHKTKSNRLDWWQCTNLSIMRSI